MTAYEKGARAYYNGESTNPYNEHTEREDFDSWYFGFNDAASFDETY